MPWNWDCKPWANWSASSHPAENAATFRRLELGLVDEVLIHVAPVLIGDDICLFSQKGMEPVRLEKTEVSEAGQITNMRFRFAG